MSWKAFLLLSLLLLLASLNLQAEHFVRARHAHERQLCTLLIASSSFTLLPTWDPHGEGPQLWYGMEWWPSVRRQVMQDTDGATCT